MKLNFYFRNIDENTKENVKNYLTEQKINRLSRLLKCENPELADLKISVQYFKKHSAFSAELNLKIIKKVLVTTEKSHDIHKAIDSALDNLISQLRKIENIKHDK